MKKVLWISRHEMTREQRRDLERIAGGPIAISAWKDTVQDLRDLEADVACSDIVTAVLPIDMLAKLVAMAGEKPVLQAKSAREPTGRILVLPDGRREPEFAYVHSGWEQVLHVEVRTKPL